MNVKAAGLSKDISIEQKDFKDFTQPEEKSIIITNPPYGERISAPDLLGLYKMIGERLKHQFVNNEAWVLSYREECFDQIGLKPSLRTPLFNGSLECELRKYQIFQGKFDEMRAYGGDIKTAQERRLMADKKRFKQHREFKRRLEEDYEDRENHKERRGSGRDTYQNKFRSEDREDRRNYRDNHNDRHTNSRGNEWNDRRNKFRNSDHDDSRSGFRGKKDRVRGSNNNNRNKYGHRNFSQDED